jgi:hypothetical protein
MQTSECLTQSPGQDPGPVTATATWTNTADPNQHLLTGATVSDQCNKFWVQLRFRVNRTEVYNIFTVWVQPGAVHTLDQATLEAFGIYQRAFFRWMIHTGWNGQAHLTPVCTDARGASGFILADGSTVACPQS